jgi:hypothetical protein
MIKFEGKILQFGFGAVGKSFFEKLSKEINYTFSSSIKFFLFVLILEYPIIQRQKSTSKKV